MTSNTKAFIFEGRRFEGASADLLTGSFLNASDNLLITTKSPGLGLSEVGRMICRNAGKGVLEIESFRELEPLERYPLMQEAEVLIIRGYPHSHLRRVIVERMYRRRPTIVEIILRGGDKYPAEEFLTDIVRFNPRCDWHNVEISRAFSACRE